MMHACSSQDSLPKASFRNKHLKTSHKKSQHQSQLRLWYGGYGEEGCNDITWCMQFLRNYVHKVLPPAANLTELVQKFRNVRQRSPSHHRASDSTRQRFWRGEHHYQVKTWCRQFIRNYQFDLGLNLALKFKKCRQRLISNSSDQDFNVDNIPVKLQYHACNFWRVTEQGKRLLAYIPLSPDATF